MTVTLKHLFDVEGVEYSTGDDLLDGRQIRSISGHDPAANYRLIEICDRYTTSVGLEDSVDLSEGKRAFRIFEGDRNFDFTVEDRGWEWGAPEISETDIRTIGKIAESREIVVDRAGKSESVVPRGGMIKVSGDDVERIYSRKMSGPKKIGITFVIGGEPTEVRAKPDEQLLSLLEKALKQSENTGQPADAWQVTDEPGNPLDVTKTLLELGIQDGAVLLASLKAGAAG